MRALVACRAGLRVALLLARGDAGAVRLLDLGPREEMALAAHSFWAALVCLPAFAALHALEIAQPGAPPDTLHAVALDFFGYFVGWAGFALLSHSVAGWIGRARRWPRFITVWNWCNVLQYLVLVGAVLPVVAGLPDWVDETVWLVAMGWALWLEWFATRAALEVPGLLAAGMVALDFAFGLLLEGITGAAT